MLSAVTGLSRHFTEASLRDYLLRRSVRRDDGCLIIRGYGTRRGIHQKVAGRAWAHIAAHAAFVGNLDAGPKPEMVATDTASYSDIVFGLFRLLGTGSLRASPMWAAPGSGVPTFPVSRPATTGR